MDQVETYLQPVIDTLKNPYVVGVFGILAIVYGSFLAPELPPSVAAWFDNPIFKVLFIFLILAVQNINPVVAILLALGFIISMQTLNRYRVFSMANEVSQMTAQKPASPPSQPMPTAEEMQQLNREADEAIKNQQNQNEMPMPTPMPNSMRQQNQNEMPMPTLMPNSMRQQSQNEMPMPMPMPNSMRHQDIGVETYAQPERKAEEMGVLDAEGRPMESLHPMNRPTWETTALTQRVEDPNDPRNPGWKALAGPNVDVSLYELNPPFLRKNLPNQFGNPRSSVKSDDPQIYPPQYGDMLPRMTPPQKGPSRYSAYHGYPVIPTQLTGPSPAPANAPMRKNLRDLNENMPSPVVPQDQQMLPNSFMGENSTLSYYGNKVTDVVAKLNPRNDNYSGSQGLMWQPGYPGNNKGATYATNASEL
jgi:hypothetical protein